MIKRLIIVGLLFSALLGGVGYFQLVFKPQMIKGFIMAAPRPPVSVTTALARQVTWHTQRASIGTLVAEQGIDVSSQLPGIVSVIQKDNGAEVKEGESLFDLDTSVESTELANAQAALQQAEIAFKRADDLTKRAVDPISTLDQARATRDSDLAAVQRAEAIIAEKNIRAPFSGRLGIRKVDKGQYVSPGQALISLQQLDPIKVDFTMPEEDIASLKSGLSVEVAVSAWPGLMFKGKTTALESRVASDSRTLLVRAEIPNSDFKLLPGMFANVTIELGQPETVIAVPGIAVTYSLYGDSVYIVRNGAPEPVTPPTQGGAAAADTPGAPPLVAERRFVRVGETRGDLVAVLSGLQAGDEVITTGQLKLQPNSHVQVNNSESLKAPAVLPRQ
jgi:membrane fusion protein (multidrug efflux system)